MRPNIDADHEIVQMATEEAVRAAMTTPLRDPILRGVAEQTDRSSAEEADTDDDDEAGGKSTKTKAMQGAGVFLVMFGVFFVLFYWLTRKD